MFYGKVNGSYIIKYVQNMSPPTNNNTNCNTAKSMYYKMKPIYERNSINFKLNIPKSLFII